METLNDCNRIEISSKDSMHCLPTESSVKFEAPGNLQKRKSLSGRMHSIMVKFRLWEGRCKNWRKKQWPAL
jgi:hypothetical protein